MRCERPRVLAFAWPPDAVDAACEAAAWRRALGGADGWARLAHADGLEVWGRGGGFAPRWLHPNLLVLGDLHPRAAGPGSPGRAGRPPGPDEAPATAARRLTREFWGGYLALLRDPADGRTWIFRDPSGAIDGLTWTAGAVAAAANDVGGLPFGLAPHRLALDWDAITDFVRRPVSALDRCGLNGYHTVTPGDLQPLGAGPERAVAVWRPEMFASDAAAATEPAQDAAARVRQAVEQAAASALGDGGCALVEVSGGLDSAIVALAAARAAGPASPLLALNYFGDRPEGDERAWARAACAAAGLPLLEAAKPVGEVAEDDFAAFARSARPAFNALDAERDRHTAALAAAEGAGAIVTGSGGDAVFFQTPTPKVLADYRLAHGRLGWRDPFVQDVARWLRRSVWSVRRAAARAADPPTGARAGVWGPRTREPPDGPAHRWLADLEGLPPAKRLQVELVAASQRACGLCRRGQAARLVHPLLAQPVVEIGLAIPAWRHVAGGRDRAVARAAFADLLPPAILTRRSKGALTSLYSRRAAASLEVLRPYLIEGVLAEAGVLDRDALDLALRPDQLIRRADGARVMGAAMVEGWVRYWQGQAPDLATASRDGLRSRFV